MKTPQSPALQFSGYPLRTVEDNVPYLQLQSHLKIIKQEKPDTSSTQVSNPTVDQPGSWDVDWFSNYE